MDWAMPLTTHLGFSPPQRRPQFLATLGTADPVEHVRHAARIGMSGVLYPWALDRSDEEVSTVRDALADTGLGCSAIVAIPSAEPDPGIWCTQHATDRARLLDHVRRAAGTARSLGASVLAAIITHPAADAGAREMDAAAANLARAAVVAADHGMVLGIEPMIKHPLSICRSTRAAIDLVRRIHHEAVGIIYDTAHSAQMDGDIGRALDEAYGNIVLIQLGDDPGRVEPGAGNLPLIDIVIEARRRGYHGLIDLEHHWADNSVEGERRGFERLRQFDAQVRERMGREGMALRQTWA